MHIHDLFARPHVYSNLPETNNMSPIRIHTTIGQYTSETREKIINGTLSLSDAPALFFCYLIDELLSQKTKDNSALVYKKLDWKNYLDTKVKPNLRRGPDQREFIQLLADYGEDFFFTGFNLGFWVPAIYTNSEAERDMIVAQFKDFFNTSTDEITEPRPVIFDLNSFSISPSIMHFTPNFALDTLILLDKRMNSNIAALPGSAQNMYVSLLKKSTSPARFYKTSVKNRKIELVRALERKYVFVSKMRPSPMGSDLTEIYYSCPLFNKKGSVVYPIPTLNLPLPDSAPTKNSATSSVIVF